MMNQKPEVSIVIPARDEQGNLELLYQEICTVLARDLQVEWELLFIDDGSRDQTWQEIEKLGKGDDRVRGFRFQYNCGKAAALSLGFREAKGEYIFTMDGDLQDNPAELKPMKEMLDNGLDLVSGWKKVRHDPWHKVLPSRLFNLVVSWFAGIRLHDFNCGLKAYRRPVVEHVHLYGDFHRYIPVLAKWKGFRVGEKIVEHRSRKFGSSKYGVTRLLSGFLDLVTLVFLQRFAVKPLHFFGSVGMVFGVLGVAILSYFGLYWVIHGSLHVRPLFVLGGTSLIMGIQFISLGLIAEMITVSRRSGELPIVNRVGKHD
jgi:glycosyltransferase involved in cell wall biosynthesis